MNKNSRITIMMEGALCVALSVVLGYLTLFRMPQGGSINLELVPLFVFSYRHGVKWGVQAGALTGILQLILGGYVVHPVQAVLDYPAASAAIGLSGLWCARNIVFRIIATAIGSLLQFSCYVASGAVFFGSYAPEGTNVWLYAIVYNGSFLLPKVLISAAAALFLWNRLDKMFPKRVYSQRT